MNSILILFGILASVHCSNALAINSMEWESFKLKYNKTYLDRESEIAHRNVFAANKELIETHNDNQDELGFTLGVNHLADMSRGEMRALRGVRIPEEDSEFTFKNTLKAEQFLQNIFDSDAPIPDAVDWRKVPGRVTGVKDQGVCGACWAFASVGVLEGQEKLHSLNKSSKLISLSVQNMVDCAPLASGTGCWGGWMANTFDYVQKNGIEDDQAYPYTAIDGNCKFNKDKSLMSDGGYAILPLGDEQKLKEVVAKYGPVSVAVDDSLQFQLYTEGVFYDKKCKKDRHSLGHAVLVVGYGTDPKQGDYWILKNSWSEDWGAKGYMLFARNQNNMCGIVTAATIATF